MSKESHSEDSAVLKFGTDKVKVTNLLLMLLIHHSLLQARLGLTRSPEPIDRAEAFGRIAFSCHRAEVTTILFYISLHFAN